MIRICDLPHEQCGVYVRFWVYETEYEIQSTQYTTEYTTVGQTKAADEFVHQAIIWDDANPRVCYPNQLLCCSRVQIDEHPVDKPLFLEQATCQYEVVLDSLRERFTEQNRLRA